MQPHFAPAPRSALPSSPSRRPFPPPVATLLTPDERLRVDAVGHGVYDTLHRESVDDLLRELRARPVSAVLLSTSTLADGGRHAVARVAELVRGFPRVPTLALVSEIDGATPQTVLALGGSGVRTLIDTRRPEGWRMLRETLTFDADFALRQAVAASMAGDLGTAPDGCRRFFSALFTVPAQVTTVCALATQLGVLPTTLMSRFFRMRLPAPKTYLAMARLVRAAHYLENPGCTLTAVSHHLEYSSAQSFGRHVRSTLGCSPTDMRRRYDGERLFTRFRAELILPYRDVLLHFSPFGR
jgi:AraC-like DNA-binding protein